jgi:hypothetical protein
VQVVGHFGVAAGGENAPARLGILTAPFQSDAAIGTGYEYAGHGFSFLLFAYLY